MNAKARAIAPFHIWYDSSENVPGDLAFYPGFNQTIMYVDNSSVGIDFFDTLADSLFHPLAQVWDPALS